VAGSPLKRGKYWWRTEVSAQLEGRGTATLNRPA
jgi:hypothetical protein